MRHETPPTLRTAPPLAAVVCASLATIGPAPAAAELLTLRVNDAMGTPDGRVAVVVRTYAPRGVEQGQICVRATSRLKAAVSPFAVLEEAVVFSDAGDAVSLSAFDEARQAGRVEFISPSATVNMSDGPLAVFFFRLQGSLTGGEVYEIEVDLAETALVDADGEAVPVEPRAGDLRVRPPGAAVVLAAEGDAVAAGEPAELGVLTLEPFEIAAGRAVFTYDPAFAAGPPVVTLDPRHGDAFFDADVSVPGRVEVTFQSPGGSLNSVPGAIFSILLPTPSVLPGASTVVALDPGETWLEGPDGQPIELALESDVLDLTTGAIFADGFESGDLSRGWAAVP